MKKFFLKLGVFVAIQMAILVFVVNYGSVDANTNEYMYCLKDKYDLLRETPSPRIIFVGGSNLAFGLKSAQLQAETGLNPVNLGVHGRLGVYSMIRLVKEQIRDGDIVVLSPEYGAMFSEPRCNQDIAVEAYRVWPGCKPFIQPDIEQPLESLAPRITPLRKLGQCVARTRSRLEQSWSTNLDENGDPPEVECYRRASFNRFGDHVAHYQAQSTYIETGKICFVKDDVFARVAQEMNQFAKFCEQRQATLYFLHSPFPSNKVSKYLQRARRIDEVLAKQLSFPILTNLEMATFPDDQFFDGESHLNEQGAQLRTEIVCQQLKQIEQVAKRDRHSKLR